VLALSIIYSAESKLVQKSVFFVVHDFCEPFRPVVKPKLMKKSMNEVEGKFRNRIGGMSFSPSGGPLGVDDDFTVEGAAGSGSVPIQIKTDDVRCLGLMKKLFFELSNLVVVHQGDTDGSLFTGELTQDETDHPADEGGAYRQDLLLIGDMYDNRFQGDSQDIMGFAAVKAAPMRVCRFRRI